MFSIQQSICADTIRQKFLQTRIRYALLRAQCQAGKTGAFHRLIREMFENGDITHAYIICGSNELTLRQQAEDDRCDGRGRRFGSTGLQPGLRRQCRRPRLFRNRFGGIDRAGSGHP